MKKQKKSLLIHNDTQNNQVTAIVVEEKDILKKTKEFLKNITNLNEASPLGIILSAEDKKSYTVAYEKENFIILEQNGTQKSAKLYGNWDEAIINAQKILAKQKGSQKKSKIVLAQYKNEK